MNWYREAVRPRLSGVIVRYLRARAAHLEPVDAEPIVVFSPHQDDETFGCGGFMALKRRRGGQVAVVYLTDGSRSHVGHPTMTPDRLVLIRREEARAALSILDVAQDHVHFLDRPDGRLAQLAPEERERLLGSIVALLEVYKPRQVCVTFRCDLHTDHEASSDLVREALRRWARPVALLEYPIWMLWQCPLAFLRTEEMATLRKVDVSEVLALKRRAAKCYRTQTQAMPPLETGLKPAFQRRLTSRWELFFLVRPSEVITTRRE